MSTLTGVALIQKKLQHVSNQSGIYSMLDENNTVLYIGKAKHLKKRITSYTHLQSKNNRIAKICVFHVISVIEDFHDHVSVRYRGGFYHHA